MVFSSTLFLFFFLPITLAAYLTVGSRLRNLLLLTASLFFYLWGENIYVLVMLVSIAMNYIFGLLIDRELRKGNTGKRSLVFGLLANIGMLVFFKYSNFLVDNLNVMLGGMGALPVELDEVHLPIGISFFTFQAMSYIIDIYRRTSKVQKNLLNLSLYISLFPQLIAGPIVRYHDISSQIDKRRTRLSDFVAGSERFIFGLGKKVLIANPLAAMADQIFAFPVDQLSTGMAWIGISCYTLQIYFDFSGYSDMAIGLGRMFGFRFLENFNYPYVSRSIREFWRRWHISLSSWFRDYLYIPLGGNRLGESRTRWNLLIIFFLCGLWHGASWNFIVWGLIHGLFLVLERGSFGIFLARTPSTIRLSYTLFVVMNAWVFFRIEVLSDAIEYLKVLYGGNSEVSIHPFIVQDLDMVFVTASIAGVFLSMPVYPAMQAFYKQYTKSVDAPAYFTATMLTAKILVVSLVFVLSISALSVGSYNPFIYFRF